MDSLRTFPTRGVLHRPARTIAADVAVFLRAASLLWLIVHLAHSAAVPWEVPTAPSAVSTDPADLPYYAGRSLLRLFAALYPLKWPEAWAHVCRLRLA